MFTLLLLIPYFGVRALHDPDPPDISSPASAYLGLRGLNCTGAAQRPRDSVTWGPQVGVSLNSPHLSPIWPCPCIQPVTSEREQMLPSLMFVTPPRGSGSVSKATFQFPRRTRDIDTSPLQHQLSWSCFLLTDFGMIMNSSYVYNVSLFSTRKSFDPAPDKDNFYQYIIMNTYTNIKNIQVDYFSHIIGRCLKIDMFALLTPLSSPRSRSLISFSFAETGKKSASAGLEPATVCAGDRFSATRLAIPLAPWVFRYNYGDHYDVSVTHSRSDQTLPSTRLHPVVRSLNQMGFSLLIPPANPLCLHSNMFTLLKLTPPARPHFCSPSNIAFAKTARGCFSATRLTSPTAPWVFRYIPSPLTSTHTPPSPLPCSPAASHQPSTRPNLHLLQPRKSSNISRLTPRDVTDSPTNQHPSCYSTKSHAQRPITNLLLLTALLFMIALGLDVHVDDAHDEDCDNSALTPTPPAQGILQRLLSAFTPARPRVTPEPATTVTSVITNDDPAPVNEMSPDKLPELLITEPGKHETDQQPAVHSPAAPAPTTPVTSPRVTPEPATTVTSVITNDDPAPVNEMTADKLPELLITEPGKHETDQQPAVHSPAAPAPTTPVTSSRVNDVKVTPVTTNDDLPVNELTTNKLPALLITEPGKHETDQQPAESAAATPTLKASTPADLDQLELVKTLMNHRPQQRPRHSLNASSFNEAILNLGRSHLVSCLSTEGIEHGKKDSVPSLRSKLAGHFAKSPFMLKNLTLDLITEGMVLTTARRELANMGVTEEITDAKDVKTRLCNILKGIPDPALSADQSNLADENGILNMRWDQLRPSQRVAVLKQYSPATVPEHAITLSANRLKSLLLKSKTFISNFGSGGTITETDLDELRYAFHVDSPTELIGTATSTESENVNETLSLTDNTSPSIAADNTDLTTEDGSEISFDKPEPVKEHEKRLHKLNPTDLLQMIGSMSKSNIKKCTQAEEIPLYGKSDKCAMRNALTKTLSAKYPNDTTLKILITSLKKDGAKTQIEQLGYTTMDLKTAEAAKVRLFEILTMANDLSDGHVPQSQAQPITVSHKLDQVEKNLNVDNALPVKKESQPNTQKKLSSDQTSSLDHWVHEEMKEKPPAEQTPPHGAHDIKAGHALPTQTDNTEEAKNHAPASTDGLLILQKAIIQIQAEQKSQRATIDLLLQPSSSPNKTVRSPPNNSEEVDALTKKLNLLEKKLATNETTATMKVEALERRLVAGEQLSLSLAKRLEESLKRISKLEQKASTSALSPIPDVNPMTYATDIPHTELVSRCELNLQKSTSVFNDLEALTRKIHTLSQTIQYGDGVSMSRSNNPKTTKLRKLNLDQATQFPLRPAPQTVQKKELVQKCVTVNPNNAGEDRGPASVKEVVNPLATTHKHTKQAAYPAADMRYNKSIPQESPQPRLGDTPEPEDFERVERHKRKSQGKRTQVLLIHDRYHKDFDSAIFPRQYQVNRLQAGSSMGLCRQEKLATTVKKADASIIIVHLGMEQLLANQSPDQIVKHHKELVDHLLSTTNARICVSQIIPSQHEPTYNRAINTINREINEWITVTERTSSKARTRLVTYCNKSLSHHMTEDGPGLNGSGTKLLMTHLKFAISKAYRRGSQFTKPDNV